MARFLFVCAIFFLLVGEAVGDCKPTASEQDCSYVLTWNWEQGEGAPADSFQVQQEVDQNGSWYDIYSALPISERTLTDTIRGDKGGRHICWRVLACNAAGRSDPSNVVCVVTPPIEAANSVAITTRPGLLVNVSRRATDTTSIVAVLINNDEVLGPAGIEIEAPAGLRINVSRRATNTSSVVSILVNRNQSVSVNGQQK